MLPEQHDHAASRLVLAFDSLIASAGLAPRAVVLSRLLNHPAYDCFYLALAEQRRTTLITADRRLLDRLAGTECNKLAVSLDSIDVR